jgi:phosphoadenosine phosphosulfate reductase
MIDLDLNATNEKLRAMSAEERLGWARDTFGRDAVLLSSMQKSASVLMHMVHARSPELEVLFVDTGFHFRETLQLRDEFMRRYRLNLVTLYPDRTPEQQERSEGRKLFLFADGQKECCRLRKSGPFVDYMVRAGRKLAMVGLRRADGGRRAGLEPLVRDPRFGGYTLHPIHDWADDRIEAYLKECEVPHHPLHGMGYPSIGCEPCTTPVGPDEHPRAGRWRHLREPGDDGPKYCQINFSDGAGI